MSADGPLNLYNAVAIAADPQRRGPRRPGCLSTTTCTRRATIQKTNTTDVADVHVSPNRA